MAQIQAREGGLSGKVVNGWKAQADGTTKVKLIREGEDIVSFEIKNDPSIRNAFELELTNHRRKESDSDPVLTTTFEVRNNALSVIALQHYRNEYNPEMAIKIDYVKTGRGAASAGFELPKIATKEKSMLPIRVGLEYTAEGYLNFNIVVGSEIMFKDTYVSRDSVGMGRMLFPNGESAILTAEI